MAVFVIGQSELVMHKLLTANSLYIFIFIYLVDIIHV